MQAEEAAQLRLEEELRQKNDEEEAAAAAAASSDVEAGHGRDRDGRGRLLRSPSVRPRGKPKGARHFRWLIRSLMRICAIIVVLWIARVVVETYIWAYYYTYGRAPPPVVFYWRVVVTRWGRRPTGPVGRKCDAHHFATNLPPHPLHPQAGRRVRRAHPRGHLLVLQPLPLPLPLRRRSRCLRLRWHGRGRRERQRRLRQGRVERHAGCAGHGAR